MLSECKFRAADGECLRERAFPYKEFCIDGPCPHYTEPTNADRIRSMTDEELANFVSLCCGWTCAECPVGKECNGDECFCTWLEWLKQEAQCTSE